MRFEAEQSQLSVFSSHKESLTHSRGLENRTCRGDERKSEERSVAARGSVHHFISHLSRVFDEGAAFSRAAPPPQEADWHTAGATATYVHDKDKEQGRS